MNNFVLEISGIDWESVQDEGKGRIKICIAPRRENLTSKAHTVLPGSHSVTCQQHHTCICP